MGAARGDGRLARDAGGARADRGAGGARLSIAGLGPDALASLFAIVGLIWGFVADRIAARWPAHEDGSVRRVDWRTVVVMAIGSVFLWALPSRFADAGPLALFAVWFLVLQLLLATDLDQRLLPDVITLPMIPVAFVIAALGWDPLVTDFPLAIVAALVIPAALFLLSIPFGAGAIGLGDIKLLVSVGLLTGLQRAVLGVVTAALLSGVVVVALLVSRRVTLKSYIPFGPFLIVGAFWSVLLRT